MLVVLPMPGIPLQEPVLFNAEVKHRFRESSAHRNNNMWTVAIFCNDFETVDRFRIPYNVIEQQRPILLHPIRAIFSAP